MRQRIVAFTGISGVGKTTFLKKLGNYVSFQHLTAGSLINAAKQSSTHDRDKLRFDSLEENQNLLIEGFSACRHSEASIVILDGHVVINSAKGLEKISATVFERLGITFMVHLEADASQIFFNRADDKTRKRPLHAVETLAKHQDLSRKHAIAVADSLLIPYLTVRHGEEALLTNELLR
jgi:adenylate kinase